MKRTVLIIGLGKIGMLYKRDQFNFNNHSDLFFYTKKFKLVSGVDLNKKKNLIFEKKYSLKAYESFIECYQALKPKIIIICVTTSSTKKIYKQIIDNKIKPKYFIIEKPGAFNYLELKKFSIYCKKNQISLLINYQRNFSNLNLKIKKIVFKNKAFHNLKKIDIIYKKGLYNSCSHYINFLLSILDEKYFQKSIVDKQYKKSDIYDYFLNFSFNSIIPIKFIYKQNATESIIFYGKNKSKIVYKTEKKKILFHNNNVIKNIVSDIKICQQNLVNKFDTILKKKENLLKNSLLTLKLANMIEVSLLNKKKS
jgi:hypothetical protein